MVNSTEKVIESSYVAYVKYEDKEGYLNHLYGQGETILDLVPNIEDAELYDDKYEILEALSYEAEPPYDRKFFKVTKILKFEPIE